MSFEKIYYYYSVLLFNTMDNVITVSILTENLYEIYAKGH